METGGLQTKHHRRAKEVERGYAERGLDNLSNHNLVTTPTSSEMVTPTTPGGKLKILAILLVVHVAVHVAVHFSIYFSCARLYLYHCAHLTACLATPRLSHSHSLSLMYRHRRLTLFIF